MVSWNVYDWRLERLGRQGLGVYGSTTLSKRKIAIETFTANSGVTEFLISLKACELALNLTEATKIYVMELCCKRSGYG